MSIATVVLIFLYIIFFTDTPLSLDNLPGDSGSSTAVQTISPQDDGSVDDTANQSQPDGSDNADGSANQSSSGSVSTDVTGEMSVHVIDIGQGSSTLFLCDDRTIMIDAGENGTGKITKKYLDDLGIDSIDLFIATHPHSDHIGGMDELMRTVDLQTIIMPEVPSSIIPTTKTYLDVLELIDAQGKEVTIADISDEYIVGDMRLEILGPVEEYDDLNDISVISKITYGNNSVIVSGDAEKHPEADTVEKFGDSLKSQIYIVGHHGSSTSSSDGFLDAINPFYAAISLGQDNSYGHPHRETVAALNKRNIEYYRTDERGSIVFYVSNDEIRVECEK